MMMKKNQSNGQEQLACLKETLAEYGLPLSAWQDIPAEMQERIQTVSLAMSWIDNAGQDKDRSLTIEAVTFLTDVILTRRNNLPLEEMCNVDGEFLNHYQEQFNRLYDRIENILLNMNKQNQKIR
uniref:Uncharacterized protein n=1 Tax=Prevotella sp. GTC17254 TaxID=3236794 RepID=A0AB33IXX4_9BACT